MADTGRRSAYLGDISEAIVEAIQEDPDAIRDALGGGGGVVGDATTAAKGIVQLAGDLAGTAASPVIASGAVTSAKIADGTIVDADINASAAIAQAKISGLVADLAGKASANTSIVVKTANYTLTGADSVVLADATSGVITQTLPTAVGNTGKVFTIKRINQGSNNVLVATTSSQLIDGALTYRLGTPKSSVTVQSDGAAWFVIGRRAPGTGELNVKDFGATGDGTTVDTAAILAAIQAARTLLANVYFPAGTYLHAPLVQYAGMEFVGESRASTVLKLAAGSNADQIVTDGFDGFKGTTSNGIEGFGLRNITLDGNRTAQTARARNYVVYGRNYNLHDVYMLNGYGGGFYSEFGGAGNPMETYLSNVKVWNYGGTPGSRGIDWNGPHDSKWTNVIAATLDSTIRATDVAYGATPINGSTTTFPGGATTFTFVTTAAAPTALFPTSGGSFVVPVGTGLATWAPVTYTACSTAGAVTTFTGCTSPAAANVNVIASKGILIPTYGLATNMGAHGQADTGLTMSNCHFWGRNHFGVFANSAIFATNVEAEGSFIAPLVLSGGSTWHGSAVYGTLGQSEQENEVGIQLGHYLKSAQHTIIDCHAHNVGGASTVANGGGAVSIANSGGMNTIRVAGTTASNTRYVTPYAPSPDVWEAYCQNKPALSIVVDYTATVHQVNAGIKPGSSSTGGRIYTGSGAPNVSTSTAGDYYFRTDTPTVSGQQIYKATGVNTWSSALSMVTSLRNLAGGRLPVAMRNALVNGGAQGGQNAPLMSRVRHVAATDCADLRLVYGAPLASENDGAAQSMTVKVGLEYSGVTYPVSWTGRETASWDPGGEAVISDPIPVQLAAGAVFYTRTFARGDVITATSLAAAASIGDTTIQLNALPGGNTGRGYIGKIAIEGPREIVTIVNYTGVTAPYTATLAAALTSAHASAAVVGTTIAQNITLRTDLGEASVVTATDNSWTTTTLTGMALGGSPSSTLSAAVSIGDTKFTTPSAGLFGATVTIEGETLTIRTAGNGSAPYTYYTTTAFTAAHASGVAVTGSNATGLGVAPTVIVADSMNPGSAVPVPVYVCGDSISSGVGNYVVPQSSAITSALDTAVRPFVSVAKAGESAQQFADLVTSRRRRVLMTLSGWIFFTYGVNDIYGSRTLSQVQADTTTILTWARNRGLKVAMTTLTPRTTSTDQWITTGNQTIVGSGSFNVVRLGYNAWVRAGAGGLADLVVELADATETARDSGVWKADAAGPYTADGIHPSYSGYELLMKPVITTALTSMV